MKKSKLENRGVGRPSKYTDALAAEICCRLADGEPLRKICRDDHMPTWGTVHHWKQLRPEFAKHYQAARDLGTDAIAEDGMEIIDEVPPRTASGGIDPGYVQWMRLRFEGRLKLLAKWNPKRYGDSMTHRGDPDAPIPLVLNGSDVHG